MADNVLLTGVSGFLAGHIALALLEQGYTVRGSVRNLERGEKVRATLQRAGGDVSRLEIVALDLEKDAGWNEAMDGVRYLVHTASPFLLTQPKDRMDMIRPAVEGTERAIGAALKAKVERIVLTSSTVAISYGHPKERTAALTARDWTVLESADVPPYYQSKTLAEQRAWAMMDEAGRRNDLAAINPSGILGPLLDEDPGTSSALVQRLLDGSLPVMPKLPLPLIDVRDVASAHVAAMTAPDAGGQRFPMVARVATFKELANALRARFPERAKSVPTREAPDWLIRFGGLFSGEMRLAAKELGTSPRYDSSAVAKLLGRDLIPVEDAAIATAESLLAHGLIKG